MHASSWLFFMLLCILMGFEIFHVPLQVIVLPPRLSIPCLLFIRLPYKYNYYFYLIINNLNKFKKIKQKFLAPRLPRCLFINNALSCDMFTSLWLALWTCSILLWFQWMSCSLLLRLALLWTCFFIDFLPFSTRKIGKNIPLST